MVLGAAGERLVGRDFYKVVVGELDFELNGGAVRVPASEGFFDLLA